MRPNTKEARDISAKETAKIIRANLKRFKGTKFSVRSSRTSIDVTYTDGPALNDVEKAVKMSGEGFDGMIDLRYYRYHWYNPKTNVLKYAGTYGTGGSGGSIPEEWYKKPSEDFELVQLGGGFIFVRRNYTQEGAAKMATKFAKKNLLRDEMTVEPFMENFEVVFKNQGDREEFWRFQREVSLL